MKWISKEWWKYLLSEKDRRVSWYKVIVCRIKGHPCGPIWYSSGMEPNYHCKNCNDEL